MRCLGVLTGRKAYCTNTAPGQGSDRSAATPTPCVMPQRLSKRPGELAEPPQDSLPGASKVKLPRLERGPEDFSQVVKDKLQSYTRTGQACDRCKVRRRCCHCSLLYFIPSREKNIM